MAVGIDWMRGHPMVATEEQCSANWGGDGRGGNGFRCHMCGHQFVPGDGWRFVLVPRLTNVLVCSKCDGADEDVAQRWAAMHEEARTRFWWFTKR